MMVRKDKKGIREPNFFIVGAAKCGTTSLADNLKQHPQIFMSPHKEPNYFIKDVGYCGDYLELFRRAKNAIAIGEATVGYLFDEAAPFAIKKRFPEARIVIMLRNPPDMAFSLWRYMHITGDESKSFEIAISEHERNYRKSEEFRHKALVWWANYLYLDRALYYEQVKRYFDVFGRERVKVYIFEDFIKNQEAFYRDIFNFLGVDTDFTSNLTKSNEGGELRSNLVKKVLLGRYPLLRKLMPLEYRARIRSFILHINIKKAGKKEMCHEIRKRLEVFFKEDIGKLENLLGYKISVWKGL